MDKEILKHYFEEGKKFGYALARGATDLPSVQTFDELYTEQLNKPLVMQAEGSDEHICKYCGVLTSQPDEDCYKNPNRAKVAAVGQRSVGTSGSAGCVHNTLEYIGPWYSCKTCGTHFNARAEAPSEGACDF